MADEMLTKEWNLLGKKKRKEEKLEITSKLIGHAVQKHVSTKY